MSRRWLKVVPALMMACVPPRVVAPLRYADSTAATPEALPHVEPPTLAAVIEVPVPAPQMSVLPNGIKLVFVERHDVSSVSVRLIIPRNPFDPDDPASVHLSQLAFLYGRSNDDSIERRLSTRPGAGVWVRERLGLDALVWSAHGSADELDLAGELIERRSFGATLSAEEYNRRGAEWLRAVHLGGGVRSAAERYVLFGDQHPYGYGGWGRNLISLDDAAHLRASLLQPSQATLLVVGDATFARVQEVAWRWFSGVVPTAPSQAGAAPPAATPDFIPAQLVFASAGGLQQFCSIVGQGPIADRAESDALRVLSHLLSDPGSELFDETRGDLGATYGVHASLIRQRYATWLAISGNYVRGKELEAMATSLDLIKHVRHGEIRDDQLQRAREESVAQWRGALSTVDGMATYYADALERGEDLASINEEPQRLLHVGVSEVAHAAALYLAPDRLHVVVSGVPTGLEELRLGLGRAQQVRLVR